MPCKKRICVYHIIEKQTNASCYVGSSKSFTDRKAQHRYDVANGSSCPIHKYIRDRGGFDSFEIKILEEFDDITQENLYLKEKEYIQQLNPLCNKTLNVIKTHEDGLAWYKKRYQRNKENILARQSRNIKCECGKEMRKGNLPRHKKSSCPLENAQT